MLTFQYCLKFKHIIVFKAAYQEFFFFFFAAAQITLDFTAQSQDNLSTVLLQNEGLVMKLSTAEGADGSWTLRGREPWHPSLKDSNEYDESKQETCERTCGKAGEFLLEGQNNKALVRTVWREEQRSSAALHSRWRKRLQMLANKWRVRKCAHAFYLTVFSQLS